MGTIEAVHRAIQALQSDFFLWRKCSDYHDSPLAERFSFVYAESENYIVRDDHHFFYFFVNARSPKEAFDEVVNRLLEKSNGCRI